MMIFWCMYNEGEDDGDDDDENDDKDVDASLGGSEDDIIPTGRENTSTVDNRSMLADNVDTFLLFFCVAEAFVLFVFCLFCHFYFYFLSLSRPVVIWDNACAVVTFRQRRECGM